MLTLKLQAEFRKFGAERIDYTDKKTGEAKHWDRQTLSLEVDGEFLGAQLAKGVPLPVYTKGQMIEIDLVGMEQDNGLTRGTISGHRAKASK